MKAPEEISQSLEDFRCEALALHEGQSGVSLERHPDEEPESRVVEFEDAAEVLKRY